MATDERTPLTAEEEADLRHRLAESNGPNDDVGYAVFGWPGEAEDMALRLLATLDRDRAPREDEAAAPVRADDTRRVLAEALRPFEYDPGNGEPFVRFGGPVGNLVNHILAAAPGLTVSAGVEPTLQQVQRYASEHGLRITADSDWLTINERESSDAMRHVLAASPDGERREYVEDADYDVQIQPETDPLR